MVQKVTQGSGGAPVARLRASVKYDARVRSYVVVSIIFCFSVKPTIDQLWTDSSQNWMEKIAKITKFMDHAIMPSQDRAYATFMQLTKGETEN